MGSICLRIEIRKNKRDRPLYVDFHGGGVFVLCMRRARLKITEPGVDGVYHCMTRTVNGEHLFTDRDKEQLRRMLWQVADFSGVEILTYCVMDNHFHVLVLVPFEESVCDRELRRRYRVLYPKPTAYETASIKILEQ